MEHLAVLERSATCSAVAWLWHGVPRVLLSPGPQGKYGGESLALSRLVRHSYSVNPSLRSVN